MFLYYQVSYQTNEMNQYLLYILQIHVHSLHTLLKKTKQNKHRASWNVRKRDIIDFNFWSVTSTEMTNVPERSISCTVLFVYICYF